MTTTTITQAPTIAAQAGWQVLTALVVAHNLARDMLPDTPPHIALAIVFPVVAEQVALAGIADAVMASRNEPRGRR